MSMYHMISPYIDMMMLIIALVYDKLIIMYVCERKNTQKKIKHTAKKTRNIDKTKKGGNDRKMEKQSTCVVYRSGCKIGCR